LLTKEAVAVTALKKNVVAAIKEVSARLGNTVAVCRKCYVHPEIVGAYLDGKLVIDETPPETARSAPDFEQLSAYETAVLAFLHSRIGRVPVVQAA
jgi:DNA topoisomerase-1